jgi:PAS domain S-box-containing protein/diguanylate cyclase (GGDEF)-like protein
VKSKVTLLATALFLLVLALVSSIQLYHVKVEMMQLLGDQQHGFVARVAADIDQKLQTNLNAIASVAAAVPPELIGNSAGLEKWMLERRVLRSLFSDLFVVSGKGRVLVDMPARGRHGIDVSEQENFRTTVEGRKPHISKPFIGKAQEEPVVTMSAPVLDRQGRVVAVLTGSINLLQPNFLGSLNDARIGKGGSFSLMTRERTIITSRFKDRIMTQGPAPGVSSFFDHAAAGGEGWDDATNVRGLHAIYSYSQLEVVPWALIAALPIAEALAPVQHAQQKILEVTLLIALLVAPLIWYVVRRLYDPLQESLQASELRFRQMAENIREVFWLTDPAKNQILYVSPAYAEIWGRSCESLYASPREWIDAIHPEDRARVLQAAQTQAIGTYAEEYRIVRPDGAIRWIRDRAFPVLHNGREVYRIAGLAEDVTESRRVAQALQESERRFRDLLGNVKLISLMLDGNARITYCNDYLLQLTGWRREEVEGKSWFELFIPPDATDMNEVFTKLIADLPGAGHHENEILTKSGGRRLVHWNNSVLRSASGEVLGTASIGEDITDQKHAEIKINGLNRVYAVLSGINSLIVRVHERDELFREACRIAVEQGQFKMAWIGVVEPGTLKIVPIASAGAQAEEFLTLIKDRSPLRGDALQENTLSALAAREKRAIASNEIREDPRVLSAEKLAERGISSMAALPLLVADEVVGVLALYSGEAGFFDEAEMKLLRELAGDIAFALAHIEKTEKLDYLAYYDVLTGFANRTLFLQRLQERLLAERGTQRKVAVTVLDIERLAAINDAFGREAGDQLLQQVADRLKRVGGDATRLARVGPECFAVLSADVQNENDVARMTEHKLSACFEQPFVIAGQELRISAKGGIALYPNDAQDAEGLLGCAEAALKKCGGTGEKYLFFTPAMTARIAERLALENKLRQALEKDQFVLHYQPKVDLVSRDILSVEALIRWRSPELGLVPPLSFIPLLEETGLILEVGAWALRRAARDHRGWVEAGLKAPRVAVNVSPIQLRQRDFVGVVEQAILEGVAPTGIDLEITESLIMHDIQGNIEKLNAIRGLGVGIAIDDFGTGYSSLAYLARLPVETLKIDRAFIIKMTEEPNAAMLVQTMISLAHSLRLKVVAEGVETEEQAKMLRLLRCDQMQGYVFSKPLPVEELVALLRKKLAPALVPA